MPRRRPRRRLEFLHSSRDISGLPLLAGNAPAPPRSAVDRIDENETRRRLITWLSNGRFP